MDVYLDILWEMVRDIEAWFSAVPKSSKESDTTCWLKVTEKQQNSNKWCVFTYIPKMKVEVAQSCPTLCNPMDYTVHGIL